MNEEEQAPPPLEPAPGSADPNQGVASEISRRVGSILDAVEREAARLREEAQGEARRYLDHARRRADGLVAERQRRIAVLSDELINKSEAVVARLDDAAPVRQGFENLVRALGDAAERLSQETLVSGGDFQPPPFHGAPAETTPGPDPGNYAQGEGTPQPPPAQPYPYPPPAEPAAPPSAYYPPPPPPRQPETGNPFETAREFPVQPHPARAPSPPGWQAPVGASIPAAQAPPQGGAAGWREFDDARMVAIQMAASGGTRGAVREHLHRALGIAEATGLLDEVFGPGSREDARVPWTSGPR